MSRWTSLSNNLHWVGEDLEVAFPVVEAAEEAPRNSNIQKSLDGEAWKTALSSYNDERPNIELSLRLFHLYIRWHVTMLATPTSCMCKVDCGDAVFHVVHRHMIVMPV